MNCLKINSKSIEQELRQLTLIIVGDLSVRNESIHCTWKYIPYLPIFFARIYHTIQSIQSYLFHGIFVFIILKFKLYKLSHARK